MKISEFIKELNKLLKEHGDIEVCVLGVDTDCCYDGDDYHECGYFEPDLESVNELSITTIRNSEEKVIRVYGY